MILALQETWQPAVSFTQRQLQLGTHLCNNAIQIIIIIIIMPAGYARSKNRCMRGTPVYIQVVRS